MTFHGSVPAASINVPAGDGSWAVPEELPIAFVYNRRNYAVMMGTPDNLQDFAVGFSLSEEVIRSVDDIQSLDIHMSERGSDMRFKLGASALERFDLLQRRRSLIGPASCGLCGLENADALFKPLPKVSPEPISLEDEAMVRAMSEMASHQTLGQETRSTHAAAWVSSSGIIELVREDVGRHNALDKLVGAMALASISPDTGFVLMSSRCSYEIVEKCARSGIKALVSISAPTGLALRKAKSANMAIYARAKNGVVRLN